ncbi:hypothetical protein BDR26DRAFT_937488 [Obelidium mucronatum]|nr:hypothetical protein BDR26DRAFT_937488 [Obelidium mucronatum]
MDDPVEPADAIAAAIADARGVEEPQADTHAQRLAAVEAETAQLRRDVALLQTLVASLRAAAPTPTDASHAPAPASPLCKRAPSDADADDDADADAKRPLRVARAASTTTTSTSTTSTTKEKEKKPGHQTTRRLQIIRSQSSATEDDDDDNPLEFSAPPPPLLTTGEPNTENYRAWTDIVRIRYPNFQRVSPAMSKAARYFREEHNLQLVRLVAQTSLKANVTLAIPQFMQHRFLRYMEDLFVQPNTGIFGDRTCLVEPHSVSNSAKQQQRAAVPPQPSYNNSNQNNTINANKKRVPTTATDGYAFVPHLSMDNRSYKRAKVMNYLPNNHQSDASGTDDFSSSNLRRSRVGGLVGAIAPAAEDEYAFHHSHSHLDDDEHVLEPNEDGDYVLSSGRRNSLVSPLYATVISKNGLRLTRYNVIIQKLMKEFKILPKEARSAIKRGVKCFLQHEMQDQYEDCVIETDDKVQTYGIPDHLVGEFKTWACTELQRCFPTLEVADRDQV